MEYDKSLKLLNYANFIGNDQLKLYTELDHSFKIDDQIYINGGFYDNLNINLTNIYDKNYYTILDVNHNTNSFVIDYEISQLIDLTYPYVKFGGAVHGFGDPFDYVNTYNNYPENSNDNNNIHKGVYVSRAIFKSGIFKSGVINNGIFGDENNTINISCNINEISNVSDDNVTIMHFISKKVIMTKGKIDSKTHTSNINTKGYKVVEDGTLGSSDNPFHIESVLTGVDNDGYGYNIIENFKNINSSPPLDILSIKNTQIINNTKDYIILNNVSYDNCQLGSDDISSVNKITFKNIQTINNSLIRNIANADNDTKFNITNCLLDNAYSIDISSVTFDTPNRITLKTNYKDIANKNLFLSTGDLVYISNVRDTNSQSRDESDYHEFFDEYKFISSDPVNYTFGNYNDPILLTFELQNNDISGLIESDFAFGNIYIHPINELNISIIDSKLVNFTIKKFPQNTEFPYIENSSIYGGYLKYVKLFNNIINGDHTVFIVNPYQILNNNNTNNDTNMTINNAYIKSDDPDFNLISADNISYTKISNMNVYQSSLKSNVIIDKDCKLNYIEVLFDDKIKIDESITHYNNMKYNHILNLNSESTFPEKRRSPFVISDSISQQTPLLNTNYGKSYNTVSVTCADYSIYNQQQTIKKENDNSYTMNYEIPNLTYETDINYLTIPNGLPTNNPYFYTYQTNFNSNTRNYFGEFSDSANNIKTIRTDNTDYSLQPDSSFPGTDRTSITPASTDLYGIQTNYLDEQKYYNYKELDRSKGYYLYDFFEQEFDAKQYPDHDTNIDNIDDIVKIKVKYVGGDVTVNNGDPNVILNMLPGQNIYRLAFLIDDEFKTTDGVDPTFVPSSFIEIEYLKSVANGVEYLNFFNLIPHNSAQQPIPYANNNQYYIGNNTSYDNFPKEFIIHKRPYMNLFILDYMVVRGQYDVEYEIVYWINWCNLFVSFHTNTNNNESNELYNSLNFNKRTRHTFKFTVKGE